MYKNAFFDNYTIILYIVHTTQVKIWQINQNQNKIQQQQNYSHYQRNCWKKHKETTCYQFKQCQQKAGSCSPYPDTSFRDHITETNTFNKHSFRHLNKSFYYIISFLYKISTVSSKLTSQPHFITSKYPKNLHIYKSIPHRPK